MADHATGETGNPSSLTHAASPLDALRQPVFRAVWIANLVSNLGMLIQVVGASWMMTSMTTSATMVALVQGATALPYMMFSLVAGAIADNYERRKTMLMSQSFMLAVAMALTIVTWSGLLTPWLLLGFTFLIGCGMALNNPSWQASVGDMVSRPVLPAAVALNSAGMGLARSVGPATGGIIVAAAGAATAFAVNTVSYVALIVVIWRWRPPRTKRTLPPERLDLAMSAGIRYVAMSPHLYVALIRGALFGVAGSAVQSLMPLVARDLLAGDSSVYGLLLGGFGIGGVIGAFTGSRMRQTMPVELVVRRCSIVVALGTAMAATGHSLLLAFPAMVIVGAAWVTIFASLNVTVQTSAPRWVTGRALSIYLMTIFGGVGLGSWLWGSVAEAHGVAVALYLSGAAHVVGLAYGYRWPLPQSHALDTAPADSFRQPRTTVPIQSVSGPIVVTIEYRIRDEDVAEFLIVMAERRRVRLRNGARRWSLSRDLGDREVWIERYHTPTWLELVRHTQRRTQADAAVADRIRALHQGGEPPRLRHMLERQTGSFRSGTEILGEEP